MNTLTRLRNANPVDPVPPTADEQLYAAIIARPGDKRLAPSSANTLEATKLRGRLRAIPTGPRLRVAVPLALLLCAVAIAVGVQSPWNGSPSSAAAFPVLTAAPSTLSPVTLQQQLRSYGVDTHNDGLNIQQARAIATPWGVGYVLTNAQNSFLCVAAPSPGSSGWATSCGPTAAADAQGTAPTSFGYDATRDTARLLALLPAGATASVTANGQTAPAPIHDDLLAVTAKPGSTVMITIKGKSFPVLLTTGAPDQDGTSSTSRAPSQTTSTATATTVTTPQLGNGRAREEGRPARSVSRDPVHLSERW